MAAVLFMKGDGSMKKFLKGFILFAVFFIAMVYISSVNVFAEETKEEGTISYTLTGSYVNAKGKIITKNFKGTYTGYLDSNGLPDGKGSFTAKTKKGEFTYKGSFLAGVIDGKGTAKYNKNSCYGTFVKGVYTPTFGDAVYALKGEFEGNKAVCSEDLAGIIDQNLGLKKKKIKSKASDLSYLSLLARAGEYRYDFGFVSGAKVLKVVKHSYCGIDVDEIVAVRQNELEKNEYFDLIFRNSEGKEFKIGSKVSFYASPIVAIKWTKPEGKQVNCVREMAYYFGK